MQSRTPLPLLLTIVVLLAACQPSFLSVPATAPMVLSTKTPVLSMTGSPTPEPVLFTTKESVLTTVLKEISTPIAAFAPALIPMPTTTPLPAAPFLDPADWHHWPVIPIVSEYTRLIYRLGQTLGNNPNAFSVFGDCQSEPNVFLGIFETDPQAVAALPPNLQETVAWFSGSLNRLRVPPCAAAPPPVHCSGPNGTRTSSPVRNMRPRFNANYASTNPPSLSSMSERIMRIVTKIICEQS